jgi:hypothetical protein
MTIISRTRLRGAVAGLAMLIGAMHGHAEAALISNALISNALVGNSLIANALAPNGFITGASALGELNGVEVDAVSISQSHTP